MNIEEHIRRAQEEGKFDNLPGHGKPLRLDENPYTDPEWRLAFHILQSSGFSLPWIEALRDIEAQIEQARRTLSRAWQWRSSALEDQQPFTLVDEEWRRAQATFRDQVNTINRSIASYNLEVPSERFQRPVLNYERELAEVMGISPKSPSGGGPETR